MKLKILNKNQIKDYIDFVKSIYENNTLYRYSMINVMEDILKNKSIICKSTWLESIMIYDDEKPILCATLAVVDRMDNVLQITYFESALYSEQAFELLMTHAKKRAYERNISTISAGLNIHVNYGLGFLSSDYDKPQSFGMAYNAAFYNDYFKNYNFKSINLVSYLTHMQNFNFPLSNSFIKRIENKFTVRQADFKDIKKEASIYTQINNEAFSNHLFYYKRRIKEDLELFKDFKYLLKEENLLFVEYNNEPIGFMLWYPDFHQLMNKGENLGIKTVIKNKFFSNKINKFKIVEMGVLPKYQKSGAILALFIKCNELIHGKYEFCESGWILEDNKDSRNFGIKWADREYKSYKAYILEV